MIGEAVSATKSAQNSTQRGPKNAQKTGKIDRQKPGKIDELHSDSAWMMNRTPKDHSGQKHSVLGPTKNGQKRVKSTNCISLLDDAIKPNMPFSAPNAVLRPGEAVSTTKIAQNPTHNGNQRMGENRVKSTDYHSGPKQSVLGPVASVLGRTEIKNGQNSILFRLRMMNYTEQQDLQPPKRGYATRTTGCR